MGIRRRFLAVADNADAAIAQAQALLAKGDADMRAVADAVLALVSTLSTAAKQMADLGGEIEEKGFLLSLERKAGSSGLFGSFGLRVTLGDGTPPPVA